jgi:putative OPT family oligopeptide transporter
MEWKPSDKGLSPKAYGDIDGKDYEPYVPANVQLTEFTLRAVITGAIIGAIFGAANAYLGLKVGLTVSASIPAAVMAVAVFRILRQGSILETNIVQTVGSAGESLAAGVIFTIPALFIWGMEPAKSDIIAIALLGGVMGVLFMIPLRKFLIVNEHGKLPYPEGTACAEVLVAGQGDLSKAKMLFAGMGIGALYQALMHNRLFGLWSKEPITHISGFKGAEIGAEVTPELLGVGYIIGPRISAIMLGGGIMGWLVLIPLITLFGEHLANPVYPETGLTIAEMSPGLIWSRYVRYIGAGGVAFAGIFSLLKSIPLILSSFKAGIAGFGKGSQGEERTQQDLPFNFIIVGSIVLIAAIALYLSRGVFSSQPMVGVIAAILIVLFGFFFVTVSSRIVGLLGSSSNPVSGMTIATLILTCVIFLAAGFGGLAGIKLSVLTVGAFVCIAAAIAGDTSQDLKTGFLVGATPRLQQLGEFVGVIVSALTMGMVMYLLKDAIVSGDLPAPQANLMRLVVDGVMGGTLPWNLVFCGMFIALTVELLGINSLAFAVGLYLPMSLSVPIMAGGLIRFFVEMKKDNDPQLEKKRESGVLYSSGMIAGAALTGVFIMVLVGFSERSPRFLEILSRPGIYLSTIQGGNFTIEGQQLTSGYVPVSASDFPDTGAEITRISQLKKAVNLAIEADETANLRILQAELSKLEKKVSDAKTREIKVIYDYQGVKAEKMISVGKWSKVYLHLGTEGLQEAGEPETHNRNGVLAFLLLTATLIFVVFRKQQEA